MLLSVILQQIFLVESRNVIMLFIAKVCFVIKAFSLFVQVAGALPFTSERESLPKESQEGPELWCSDGVDANITTLQSSISADISRLTQYMINLFHGHNFVAGFQVKGLAELGKCGSINITQYPISNYSDDRQHIANRYWNLHLLNAMYKNILKLIRVHQYSTTPQATVSKLTLLQVMVDHFVEHLEEYLMAERCSCKDEECTLHRVTTAAIDKIVDQVRMELHPPNCTRINLLGEVINMVYRETSAILRILKKLNVVPSASNLCYILSSTNYPNGCPV